MNILVIGMPKSGTSIIGLTIATAFPGVARNFERIQFIKEEEFEKGVICKELLDRPNKTTFNENFYRKFHKIVRIVRDPRDRLVSSILYGGFNTIVNKLDVRDHFLARLRAKENDPMSVTCMELVEILKIKYKTLNPFEIPTLGTESYFLSSMDDLRDRYGEIAQITIKYEDFIDQNFSDLELFLDTKFIKTNLEFTRTARSKKYGEWKNWFTPTDIEHFRPIADPIIDRYNYSDWTVNENPIIDPEKSSKWAEFKINERYEMYLQVEEKKRKELLEKNTN